MLVLRDQSTHGTFFGSSDLEGVAGTPLAGPGHHCLGAWSGGQCQQAIRRPRAFPGAAGAGSAGGAEGASTAAIASCGCRSRGVWRRLFSRAALGSAPTRRDCSGAGTFGSASRASSCCSNERAGATDGLLTLSTRPSTQTVVARTSERSASNTFQAGAAEERPVGGLVTQH